MKTDGFLNRAARLGLAATLVLTSGRIFADSLSGVVSYGGGLNSSISVQSAKVGGQTDNGETASDHNKTRQKDKDLHLLGGLGLSFITIGLVYIAFPQIDFFENPLPSMLVGLGVGLVAGAIKEVADGFFPERHKQEFLDLFATTIGGWIGAALFLGAKSFFPVVR